MEYTPTKIKEECINDTIYQQFATPPEATPKRGLLSVKIIDHKKNPIVGHPILLNDTRNDSVFISYSGSDGLGYFLLPKGIRYKLSYSVDDHSDLIYFKPNDMASTIDIIFYSSGLILDESNYEIIKKATTLTDDLYQNLPSSSSLVSYCPQIGDQGEYGTCTAWATAYYGYYIVDGLETESKNKDTYSPTWVYENIKHSYDKNCTMGSSIEDALELLRGTGNITMNDLPYSCGPTISNSLRKKAATNKIKDFRRLFDWGAEDQIKISRVKKSLAEKQPVIIGFSVNESFSKAGDLWVPEGGLTISQLFGGHAMTVVAYDDNKYGGAFRLINSWGTDWGNKGYTWVRYNDFAEYCKTAFEIFENLSTENPDSKKYKVEWEITKPDITNIEFLPSNSSLAQYKIATPTFRNIGIRIKTEHPAYLYILGINQQGQIKDLHFGGEEILNPYLGYNKNSFICQWEDLYHYKKLIFVLAKNRKDYQDYVMPLFDLSKADYATIYKKMKNNLTDQDQFSKDKIEVCSTIKDGKTILVFGVELEKK